MGPLLEGGMPKAEQHLQVGREMDLGHHIVLIPLQIEFTHRCLIIHFNQLALPPTRFINLLHVGRDGFQIGGLG